jgi:hypothetical protein
MTSPEDLKTLVAALKENADRLGLTWNRRYGTVTQVITSTSVLVQMDGSNAIDNIPCVCLVPVLVGTRVVVDSIPPAGKFVVGSIGGGFRQMKTGPWSATTVASTNATQAVSFGMTFDAPPFVSVNIISTAGGTQTFMARAINITTTGFTVWIFNTAGTAVSQGVLGQYLAVLME